MTDPVLRVGIETYYGERGDLCLCLSGGGFRAAAFHLGVVRWLYVRRLLSCVDEVRSVSGGSLLAAWLLKNEEVFDSAVDEEWFASEVAAPFSTFLGRDLRSKPVLRTLGLNVFAKGPRCRLLAKTLEEFLAIRPSRGARKPAFRMLAFDVDSQTVVELQPREEDLALQVTASAAFPPWFGPVRYGGRRLIDGGIAGNLAVNSATLHRSRCTFISDASRTMPRWLFSSKVPLTLKLLPIVREGANRVFRAQVGAADSDQTLVGVAALCGAEWYGTHQPPGGLAELRRAARFRTDLAGFSAERIAQLYGFGLAVAEASLGDVLETWAVRLEAGDEHLAPGSARLRRVLEDYLEQWGSRPEFPDI